MVLETKVLILVRLQNVDWLFRRTSSSKNSKYRSACITRNAVRTGLLLGAFVQPFTNGDDDRLAVINNRYLE